MTTLTIASLRRSGGSARPPITILYGKPGIGKTTFAACAPGPIFVQTEDGLQNSSLDHIETFGVLTSYEQVLDAFTIIATHHAERGWKTVVIDSMDRLMPLMADYVCRQNGWNRIEDGEYGAGKNALLAEARRFMDYLIELRNQLGLGPMLLGHHKAVKVTPPDAEPYIQYSLSMIDDVTRIFVGDSDLVMFATYPITTHSTKLGFNKTVTRATMDKPRVYTRESGSHVAKNRFDMPSFMTFEWKTVCQYVPFWRDYQPPQQMIDYIAGQPSHVGGSDPEPQEISETAGELVGE